MSKDTQETPSETSSSIDKNDDTSSFSLDFFASVKNSLIKFSDKEEIRNIRDKANNLIEDTKETISDTANNLAEQTEKVIKVGKDIASEKIKEATNFILPDFKYFQNFFSYLIFIPIIIDITFKSIIHTVYNAFSKFYLILLLICIISLFYGIFFWLSFEVRLIICSIIGIIIIINNNFRNTISVFSEKFKQEWNNINQEATITKSNLDKTSNDGQPSYSYSTTSNCDTSSKKSD